MLKLNIEKIGLVSVVTVDGILNADTGLKMEEALNDDIRYDYNNPNIWEEDFR